MTPSRTWRTVRVVVLTGAAGPPVQAGDDRIRALLQRLNEVEDELRTALTELLTRKDATSADLVRTLSRMPHPEASDAAEQIRSSSGLVVFVPETDDRAGWVAAGRAYQRFALQATAIGVRCLSGRCDLVRVTLATASEDGSFPEGREYPLELGAGQALTIRPGGRE